jgi:AP-2 complex subunit sigma-1
MIRFILLQNRQGKTRLAKYYVPLEEDEKHQLETEVHRVVVNRDPKHTSFVEFKNHKLVYRRYAGLFFTLCVDANDNELVHLESIHLFVEILDHFFANVCELDLVFNFQKVYVIVDEFILAGEVQETSKKAILNRLAELEQIKGWSNVDGNINIYLDDLRALKQNYFLQTRSAYSSLCQL